MLAYKSHGLGQAKLEPSHEWGLWPGLGFEEAKATLRPSQARTSLQTTVTLQLNNMMFAFVKALVPYLEQMKNNQKFKL